MIITIILSIFVFYLGLGLVFAIPFLLRGAGIIDEGTKESSTGFRIIIIPGVVVFWPYLLHKWIKVKNNSHDEAP